MGRPIAGFGDPRWVLAVRCAEALQGAVLPPDKRQRLVDLGKRLGLTPFDANLVIAIVQDQARRGYAPELCPSAGEAQLRMVPLPGHVDADGARRRRAIITAGWLTLILGAELAMLWLIVG